CLVVSGRAGGCTPAPGALGSGSAGASCGSSFVMPSTALASTMVIPRASFQSVGLGGRPAARCSRRFMTKTIAASILPFGAPASPMESMERPDSSSMRSISPSVRLLTSNMVWVPSQSDQLVLAEQLFQPGVERLEDVAAFTVERLDEELVGLYVTRRPAVVDNPRVRS